mmetsp:Transcript_26125/g.44067  ORF Transcript_26125/g.44067 Transcript_26125/m.44067 type:complete len:85 (-) Transcript_26125:60-314(-)
MPHSVALIMLVGIMQLPTLPRSLAAAESIWLTPLGGARGNGSSCGQAVSSSEMWTAVGCPGATTARGAEVRAQSLLPLFLLVQF